MLNIFRGTLFVRKKLLTGGMHNVAHLVLVVFSNALSNRNKIELSVFVIYLL